MKIGQVIKEQQPDIHKKLNNKSRKKCRRGKESLSFSDKNVKTYTVDKAPKFCFSEKA